MRGPERSQQTFLSIIQLVALLQEFEDIFLRESEEILL